MGYNSLIHKRATEMSYYDDDFLFGVFAVIVIIAIFALGINVGSELSEQDNITKGRSEGIILCSEKPTECKIEYDYLKLKGQLKK
jgi:hypothetical protein